MEDLLGSRAIGCLLVLTALLAACADTTFESRPAICTGTPAFDLWVVDKTGLESRLVDTSGADGFADWSPDGRQLTFASSRDGTCDIFAVDSDGSGLVTIVADDTDELYPSWSHDGSRIVFSRYDDSGAQLWIVDVDNGHETRLTDSALLHDFPDWSPDGEWILFAGGTEPAGPGAVREIYRVSAVGGEEIPITHGERLLGAPKWSPDGRQIVYFDHTDALAVWVMDSDGLNQRRVAGGGHVAWSPDGMSLVFDREVSPGDVDLFVDGEPLVDSGDLDSLPAWSPDGSRIAFSSDRP